VYPFPGGLMKLALAVVLSLAVCWPAFAGDKAKPAPAGARREVTVTQAGFVVKDNHPLKKGEPVTLVVTRKVDKTCAKDIVLKDFDIKQALPLDKAVEVTFTPKTAGKVHFSCAMNMLGGDLTVE
jgi:plastocyanin domain-containing protein